MEKKNIYCYNCQSLMVYVKNEKWEKDGFHNYECIDCGETRAQHKNAIDDKEEKTKYEEDKKIT